MATQKPAKKTPATKKREIAHEVATAVDPASEREADAAEPAAETAAPDHRAVHGSTSILGDVGVKDYRIVHEGTPYVHVGEWGNQWVYRPA